MIPWTRHIDACAALTRMSGEGCCTSCVQDEASGISISEIESPTGRFWSSVCCLHARMQPRGDGKDKARRAWWAALLREVRRGGRS